MINWGRVLNPQKQLYVDLNVPRKAWEVCVCVGGGGEKQKLIFEESTNLSKKIDDLSWS